MKDGRDRLTLDRAMTYEIRVPGRLDETWSDSIEGITVIVDSGGAGPTITTLSIVADQAALQGFLDRLYALGLPLLSVNCIDTDPGREMTG